MKFKEQLSFVGYFLVTGVLATITMDMTALTMVKSGIIHLGDFQIVPSLLGRWVGYFPAGIFFHSTILETQPLAHERLIGILSHNLIGVTLTTLVVYPHVLIWRQKIAPGTAVLFGICTCLFPYFVMFPAMALA